MTKKVLLWYLYDFANSFASVVLIFYYPLILSEKGINDAWIGVTTSLATIILLFLMPYLGHLSDRTGKRVYFLRWVAFSIIISLFAIAYLASSYDITKVSVLLLVSLFYILFQVCFQGTGVFYSSILRFISNEETGPKISGIGTGLGQLGNAICLALVGPIVGAGIIVLGFSGKPLALIIGASLFVAIAIPFLFSKEFIAPATNQLDFSYIGFVKKIIANKNILWFIVAYSLLADAILTFQIYATIYLKNVFELSDKDITYVGVVGLLFAVVGGFLAGMLVSLFKSKKKAFNFSAALYTVTFISLATVPAVDWIIYAVFVIGGLAYGFVFSIARALYAELVPKEEQAEYFSAYTVFEKAASIIGPLVWIASFNLLSPYGENIQYRGSVVFLMVVCLLGMLILRKVETRL